MDDSRRWRVLTEMKNLNCTIKQYVIVWTRKYFSFSFGFSWRVIWNGLNVYCFEARKKEGCSVCWILILVYGFNDRDQWKSNRHEFVKNVSDFMVANFFLRSNNCIVHSTIKLVCSTILFLPRVLCLPSSGHCNFLVRSASHFKWTL